LGSTSTGLRLRIVEGDGRVLMDSVAPEDTTAKGYESFENRRALAQRMGERLLAEEQPLTDDELLATAPLMLPEGRSAVIELSRPLRSVNEFIWSERKKLAGVSLVIAGAMVIAGWLLATRLTRSLDRLTIYARRVRDGRNGPLPKSRAT